MKFQRRIVSVISCAISVVVVLVHPGVSLAVSAPASVGNTVALPLPDLVVSHASFSRSTLVANAMVENRGTADLARDQRATVYFEFLNAAGERVRATTVAVPASGSMYDGIRIGRSVEYQLRKTDPGGVSMESAAQIVSVRATVNPSGRIDEISDANNSITVDATGPVLQTDLVIQTAEFDRTTRTTRVVVKNQGGGNLEHVSGQYFTVQVKYLGVDGAVLGTATERGPGSYGIGAGRSEIFNNFLAPSPHLTDAIVRIEITLNTDHLPYESDRTNDAFVGEVRGVYPRPDLVITSARFDKDRNQTIVHVANNGTTPVKTSDRFGVSVTYMDATGAVLAHSTGIWNHAYEIGSGRSTILDRFMLEPSARIASQVDHVSVVLDANNELIELNENNNLWPVPEFPTSTPPTVEPVVPDVPQVSDLVVSSVIFNQATGIPTASVKNIGTASAMQLPVGIGFQWLNADGVTVGASVVNVSEAITVQETVTVRPGQVPDGAAVLRVSVDSVGNHVPESDETNNTWEGPVEKPALTDAQRADLLRRIAARAVARTAAGITDEKAAQMAGTGDVSSDSGEHAVSLDVVRRVTKESNVNKKQVPRVVPGNPLYFFKDAYRKARVLATFDESKKAQQHTKYAAEKTLEAGVLADKGKEDAAAKQIEAAQKEQRKALEKVKTLIIKDDKKAESVVETLRTEEQKQAAFLKVISRSGAIEKSINTSAKQTREQTENIETLLAKKKEAVREKKPGEGNEKVIPVPPCAADEWNCNWNACVWVGPGTEQGQQTLQECYKVFECATAETPAPQRAGDVRACSTPRSSSGGGGGGTGTATPKPAASCTADEWNCNWNACTWVGPGTEQGKQTLKECYKVFDCATADTPAPQRAGDTKDCSTPKPVASCTADEWNCNWNACIWVGPGTEQGEQTLKECYKVFDCSTATTPAPYAAGAKKACSAPAPACLVDSWSCGAWTTCSADGTQTRTCTLSADCPTANTPRPATSQACVPPAASTPPAATTAPVYASTATAFIVTGGHVSPQRIDIAPGGTITFQNVDFETHVVRFSFGQSITLSPGSSQAVTAPTAQDLYNVYTDSRTSPNGLIVVSQ